MKKLNKTQFKYIIAQCESLKNGITNKSSGCSIAWTLCDFVEKINIYLCGEIYVENNIEWLDNNNTKFKIWNYIFNIKDKNAPTYTEVA